MEKEETIEDLNKIAKKYDLKLINGSGFYYWIGLTEETKQKISNLQSSSIYLYRFTQLPFKKWIYKELSSIVYQIHLPNEYDFTLFENEKELE